MASEMHGVCWVKPNRPMAQPGPPPPGQTASQARCLRLHLSLLYSSPHILLELLLRVEPLSHIPDLSSGTCQAQPNSGAVGLATCLSLAGLGMELTQGTSSLKCSLGNNPCCPGPGALIASLVFWLASQLENINQPFLESKSLGNKEQ